MKLSKYFKNIQINKTHYACFNSLILNIIFVDQKKLDEIINFKINDKEELKILLQYGIYIKEEKSDQKAYDLIKNNIEKKTYQIGIMYLNISTHCNLACTYCFIDNNPESTLSSKMMSFDTAKIAIDKFLQELKNNQEEKGQVIIYGGEPITNWPVLKKIIQYYRSRTKTGEISIISNGTLIDKQKIIFLKKYDVGLGISLDGPQKINDKNRVFKNSNESVTDAVNKTIDMLNEEKKSFCVSATLTEEVIENEKEIMNWLKAGNIKNIAWNLYYFSTYDPNWETYYQKMTDFIFNNANKLIEMEINESKITEQTNMFLDKIFKFHNCGAVGLKQVTIKPNGDICVCQGDSRSTNKIGNIHENELADVIRKPEVSWWRDIYTINRPECLKCEAIAVCGGGCPLQAKALFRDQLERDQAICIYFKKLLRWLLNEYYQNTIK